MTKTTPHKSPLRVMLKQYIALGAVEQNKIAQEIGVANSTLSRFLSGKMMDQDGTLKLIAWLFWGRP